jgi:hypothetical protein
VTAIGMKVNKQTIKNSQSSSHLEDSLGPTKTRDRTLDPVLNGIKINKDNPVSPNATALAKK